ncbi:family 20 glycosylhydrolase [Microbacterium horticulturae]|uniref:beta-N-acetylhexosaminidase n=1 Tax=Microbacterium horticulturae TaxID=3028316 RepID=A0ABY8BV32_9MICO|nr:family 20 glycosylhydrolase [Microbacterium sp. KACC 23027]WEG08034.1 family 20 glycosylhydrolase [Microbacterium sp. KACC 23027]
MPAFAPVPCPRIQTVDATAAPFALSEASRLVTVPAGRATAELAAAALAPVVGRTLEVADDLRPADGDLVLEYLAEDTPETYTLTVEPTRIRVLGGDEAGLFYGVQTLVQLLAASPTIPAQTIDDAPRFAYRGVMLDVARHFFPVEVVEGYIDRAAALKFNALHLHLTDDQGWRIRIDSRPELTDNASGTSALGDPGGFYSKDDYARIVRHAASRHMIVVPEVDAPSHTHAISLAYPELMEPIVLSDHIREVVDVYGGGIPEAGRPYTGFAVGFSALKAHDDATYAFLGDVYRELAEMTPGPYLHVGGDEALGMSDDDFAVFMDRATALVSDLGKTPIAWHEAGSSSGLSPDTIGQYWGFVTPTDGMDEKTRTFVRAGARVILSPADAIYLDMKLTADSPTGLTWANGPTSVHDAYAWEPTAIIDGIGEADILGVEAPLWTETVRTPGDIDAQAFPRIAAAAEAAWSPAAAAAVPERTWDSFRARVGALGPLWRAQGIAFAPADEIDWA